MDSEVGHGLSAFPDFLRFIEWRPMTTMTAEEEMLIAHFGDAYRAYKMRTWRLVPYIW